jgi:hypothetical protein
MAIVRQLFVQANDIADRLRLDKGSKEPEESTIASCSRFAGRSGKEASVSQLRQKIGYLANGSGGRSAPNIKPSP